MSLGNFGKVSLGPRDIIIQIVFGKVSPGPRVFTRVTEDIINLGYELHCNLLGVAIIWAPGISNDHHEII
jgi:hypothetical protein